MLHARQTEGMKLLHACFMLALGCTGTTPTESPPDASVDASLLHTPQGEVLDALPKCVQSPDPEPWLCQQRRFGERVGHDTESWCAYWVVCPQLKAP